MALRTWDVASAWAIRNSLTQNQVSHRRASDQAIWMKVMHLLSAVDILLSCCRVKKRAACDAMQFDAWRAAKSMVTYRSFTTSLAFLLSSASNFQVTPVSLSS